MNAFKFHRPVLLLVLALASQPAAPADAQSVSVDLSGYSPSSGIEVKRDGERLHVAWPMAKAESGRLTLDLRAGKPLIESLGIATSANSTPVALLQNVEPAAYLSVGTRTPPPGHAPERTVWDVFFDKVPNKPFQTHRSRLEIKRVVVTSVGRRATVALSELSVGNFSGELCFTFYAGSRLVHIEAVVSTEEDRRAILYDMGLVGAESGCKSLAWLDTAGRMQRAPADSAAIAKPLAVAHRTLIAEGERGAVACFPPPHQFFSPRDWSDNLQTAWFGKGYSNAVESFGFGIRSSPTGGGPFLPWFNAPPHTRQRLGMFLLLSRGKAEDALRETLRYTHDDQFPALPGRVTYTSHYHLAHTAGVMKMRAEGKEPPAVPEFVQ
ncbi:MAG: hypothetical protein HY301_03660 [Verrucomicrobia bacterium]|nr:hypothetical protein [Verrucomicrobiota bacterium]